MHFAFYDLAIEKSRVECLGSSLDSFSLIPSVLQNSSAETNLLSMYDKVLLQLPVVQMVFQAHFSTGKGVH